MKFLAWCPITMGSLPSAIGKADYSYAFVMKAFLPILRRIGDVEVVEGSASDVELLSRTLSSRGERFRVICFCPPNLVPAALQGPVTAVVAWEFESIPTVPWAGNPANDWRQVLKAHGQVITLSTHSAEVIKRDLGADYPVTAVPIPVFGSGKAKPGLLMGLLARLGITLDGSRVSRARPGDGPPLHAGPLLINGEVLTYRNFETFQDDISGLLRRGLPEWDGQTVELTFGKGSDTTAALLGFYENEEWGVWSFASRPIILLPFSIRGHVTLQFMALAYANNDGRAVQVSIGGTTQTIRLSNGAQQQLHLHLPEPASAISVAELDTRPIAGAKDPRTMGLGLISLRIFQTALTDEVEAAVASSPPADWSGVPIVLDFSRHTETPVQLFGFFDLEDWGVWSASAHPVIVLPVSLEGKVSFRLLAFAYGNNIGKVVEFAIGGARRSMTLTGDCLAYEFTVDLAQPARIISFSELDTHPVPGAEDPRSMGIGLVSLTISRDMREAEDRAASCDPRREGGPKTSSFEPDGVVFTSVLNPADGRKNLADIVSAFCYALGGRQDATLVLKLTHHSVEVCVYQLYMLLRRIGPIQAKIVIAQGYLDDESYRRLIDATAWYVNASHGEGLCIPLIEFMSDGVPAIAPSHTAMRDYITSKCALVVESSRMPTRWPDDPEKRIRTLYYRINWQSLADCFVSAYEMAKENPRRYARMSRAAVHAQRRFSSSDRIEGLLRNHFSRISP